MTTPPTLSSPTRQTCHPITLLPFAYLTSTRTSTCPSTAPSPSVTITWPLTAPPRAWRYTRSAPIGTRKDVCRARMGCEANMLSGTRVAGEKASHPRGEVSLAKSGG